MINPRGAHPVLECLHSMALVPSSSREQRDRRILRGAQIKCIVSSFRSGYTECPPTRLRYLFCQIVAVMFVIWLLSYDKIAAYFRRGAHWASAFTGKLLCV